MDENNKDLVSSVMIARVEQAKAAIISGEIAVQDLSQQ